MLVLQRFGYFILTLMCKLGLHSDYKHDGEWMGQCAFCNYGHPEGATSTFQSDSEYERIMAGPSKRARLLMQSALGAYARYCLHEALAPGSQASVSAWTEWAEDAEALRLETLARGGDGIEGGGS